MQKVTIGAAVRVVNFHGEPIRATFALGVGYVRAVFDEFGEQRAEIYFPAARTSGSWPVDMLKAA